MNKKQLEKIKNLLSFGDIKAKGENEYIITDKAVIKLINEIERLRQFEQVSGDFGEEEYEPYFGWCDVDGCEFEGCSGGNAWRETGYWIVCSKHANECRAGKPQPKMKQKSIDRENGRDKVTGYLPSVSQKDYNCGN